MIVHLSVSAIILCSFRVSLDSICVCVCPPPPSLYTWNVKESFDDVLVPCEGQISSNKMLVLWVMKLFSLYGIELLIFNKTTSQTETKFMLVLLILPFIILFGSREVLLGLRGNGEWGCGD